MTIRPFFLELYNLMGRMKAELDDDKLSNEDILRIIGLLCAMHGTLSLRLNTNRPPFVVEEEKEKK